MPIAASTTTATATISSVLRRPDPFSAAGAGSGAGAGSPVGTSTGSCSTVGSASTAGSGSARGSGSCPDFSSGPNSSLMTSPSDRHAPAVLLALHQQLGLASADPDLRGADGSLQHLDPDQGHRASLGH